MRSRLLAAAVCAWCTAAACATRTVPTQPAVLAYPDFMYPAVPASLGGPGAARVEAGWGYLQSNDLDTAALEFAGALERSSGMYPARTGSGYVALARGAHDAALNAFDGALRTAPTYVPALVGRGQTLLALKREGDALEAFEAALTADPSLADVRRRVDVLRFRGLQELIETARAAATSGQLDAAAGAYARALKASPDSAFLHRELGMLERKRGNADAALSNLRRAVELEPSDAPAFMQIGELLEARGDVEGADASYRRASEIDPTSDVAARRAALAERTRDAALPAQFRAITTLPQATRGDLAALVGVRLEEVLRRAPPREVVVTDAAGHWAAPWIGDVARAGVIEPFANHTFQPANAVTRADLAVAVERLVSLIAADRPDLRQFLTARPRIDDMPAAHVSYPAASVAVAAGLMPLAAGERFEPARVVSGAEASEVVLRVRDRVSLAR